jgi:alpha-tubulin suppressor-like RCC1 family protein
VGSVKSVASGFLATCVLNTSGQVYCWGDDAYGELGDGQNGPVDGGFFRPVLNPQLLNF